MHVDLRGPRAEKVSLYCERKTVGGSKPREVLNEVGKEGWELVTTIITTQTFTILSQATNFKLGHLPARKVLP